MGNLPDAKCTMGVLASLQLAIPPGTIAIAVGYLLLGDLFYGCIMTGMLPRILRHPSAGLAVGLSLFPPTPATAMMLRLAAPSSLVPP